LLTPKNGQRRVVDFHVHRHYLRLYRTHCEHGATEIAKQETVAKLRRDEGKMAEAPSG
jgi:hypothetical protein